MCQISHSGGNILSSVVGSRTSPCLLFPFLCFSLVSRQCTQSCPMISGPTLFDWTKIYRPGGRPWEHTTTPGHAKLRRPAKSASRRRDGSHAHYLHAVRCAHRSCARACVFKLASGRSLLSLSTMSLSPTSVLPESAAVSRESPLRPALGGGLACRGGSMVRACVVSGMFISRATEANHHAAVRHFGRSPRDPLPDLGPRNRAYPHLSAESLSSPVDTLCHVCPVVSLS